MLRLIANKAWHHYNLALEHAERHRYHEAIGELQNALDLDSSMVDAHVIMGTVYARLNQPDEARAQWEKALEISKPHQRAHIYLQKLRQLRPYRGVLRRLHVILAGFGLATALCLILLVHLFWPNVPAKRLDRAWKAYKAENLAAARETLDELSRPVADTALELSAQSLAIALERDFQDAMAGIERLRRQDHPYQAIEEAQAFLDRRPPPYARDAVEQAVHEIRSELVESIRRRVTEVGDSSPRLDQAENALARFAAAFPDSPEREGLEREYVRAEERYAAQTLGRIRQAYAGSRDYSAALIALRSLRDELAAGHSRAATEGRASALRDEIDAELARITDVEFASLLDRVRESMQAGELRPAAEDLDRAQRLPVADEMKQAQLASLRADLGRRQRETLLASIQTGVARHDWDAALAAADHLTSAPLDRDTRDEVDRMAANARRARAVATYYWLMRRADKIESARIDAEEARDVAVRAGIVLDSLPMELYPAALDDTLFFLASAQRVLGEEAEFRQTLERLRRECPKSRYLGRLDPITDSPAEGKTDGAGKS